MRASELMSGDRLTMRLARMSDSLGKIARQLCTCLRCLSDHVRQRQASRWPRISSQEEEEEGQEGGEVGGEKKGFRRLKAHTYTVEKWKAVFDMWPH
jgi:hypothetical protein